MSAMPGGVSCDFAVSMLHTTFHKEFPFTMQLFTWL